MKKIIFIDDLMEVLQLQLEEMQLILDGTPDVELESILCNMAGVADCLNDEGKKTNLSGDSYQAIYKVLDHILQQIDTSLETCDRVEAVIDLFLDDEDPKLGYLLAKFILTNMQDHVAFTARRFLITLTTSYISTEFSRLRGEFLTAEEQALVVECYRPFIPQDSSSKSNSDVVIDKKMTAYPEFYVDYRCKGDGIPEVINQLLLDEFNVPGNKGTYYGNYFGLIYARLYKDRGENSR